MEDYGSWAERPLWYVLKDGVPVPEPDTKAAAEFFANSKARIVQHDSFPDPRGEGEDSILVSTVFLSLDHNHSLFGPPVLWETMIFWEGGPLDEYQERYTSKAAARAGHERALERVRAALNVVEAGGA